MAVLTNLTLSEKNGRTPWMRIFAAAALALVAAGTALASDGGTSVYPAGVETIMPGRMPPPGGTMFLEFNNFYVANQVVGPHGESLVPGFHVRVSAVAGKVLHNWGVHVLGGTLVSTAALPLVDIHLNAPFGSENKIGLGNADLETAVAYHKGDLFWWYGFEVFPPGLSYKKNDLVNVGQHNWAVAPSGAVTYMPNHGRTELSSKYQYIVNYTNPATDYRSGHEFVWEYAAMQNVTRRLAIGANGYFYKQTTDDLQNGITFLDGNQGRNLAFGPEIRCHFNRYMMILKWERDFLTQNRTVGNALWLQIGVPLGHHE